MRKICNICGGEYKVVTINGKEMYKCAFCDNIAEKEDEKPASNVNARTNIVNYAEKGEDVFDANINSVMEITGNNAKSRFSGSGFMIDDDGYAITNAHVVTENGNLLQNLKGYICGRTVDLEVKAVGSPNPSVGEDLALVKLRSVPAGMKKVKLADSKSIRNGQRVFVIGNSLGLGTCITSGIVSDKRRSVNGQDRLMTDCAINGGNSGGPIFNENGEVIAVVVSGIDEAEGMNFGIPVDIVQYFIDRTLSRVK